MYEIPELLDPFYKRFTYISGTSLGILGMMRNNRSRTDVLIQLNGLQGHIFRLVAAYETGLRMEIMLLSKPPIHSLSYSPEELHIMRQVRERCPSYLLKELPFIIDSLLKLKKF